MGFFKRLEENTELFHGMTDRLGLDLIDTLEHAPEKAQQFRAAVLSCSACDKACDCKAWQADHDHADTAPDYCRNRFWFKSLMGEDH